MYTTLTMSLSAAMLVGACQAADEHSSDVMVTNGKAISEDEYPAVVKITIGSSSCTASFVSPRVLLTAAHCIYKKGLGNEVRSMVHPLYAASGEANRADLALIEFKENRSNDFLKIAADAPAVGDAITIVGYGLKDAEDRFSSGQKRKGSNTLQHKEGGLLVFGGVVRGAENDGVESASASGDSGGPMLAANRLIGVTSAGIVKGDTKFSMYVDLHSDDSKSFFRQATDAG